jgi:hypothetical protein
MFDTTFACKDSDYDIIMSMLDFENPFTWIHLSGDDHGFYSIQNQWRKSFISIYNDANT